MLVGPTTHRLDNAWNSQQAEMEISRQAHVFFRKLRCSDYDNNIAGVTKTPPPLPRMKLKHTARFVCMPIR
jgi:hypothetical protein